MVKDIKVNDRILVDPTVRLEKGFEVIGVNRHGGLAEYVKVPAKNVVKIPEGISFDEACTIPICTVTALYGLLERGGLKAPRIVLISSNNKRANARHWMPSDAGESLTALAPSLFVVNTTAAAAASTESFSPCDISTMFPPETFQYLTGIVLTALIFGLSITSVLPA